MAVWCLSEDWWPAWKLPLAPPRLAELEAESQALAESNRENWQRAERLEAENTKLVALLAKSRDPFVEKLTELLAAAREAEAWMAGDGITIGKHNARASAAAAAFEEKA